MEPKFVSAKTRIQLTSQETELFAKLLEVVQAAQTNTTLRVAGGWVRDKLLGQHSEDIDVTLDNMMGETFANHIVAHLQTGRHHGVVKANPEASKHLETACIHVFGFDLDLVNLRSEDYSSDSRIPQITFGTPSQDAYRRDLTINSMFYNLAKEEIEDWTGLGLTDLQEKIARTPLPPLQTFLDDPLRVLRTIRFTARFHLSLLPEIATAAQESEVRCALFTKVSRERIAKEFTLMAKGNNPFGALELMHQLRQIDVLLKVPQEVEDRSEEGLTAAMRLQSAPFQLEDSHSPQKTFLCITSALISPYRHLAHRLPKKKVSTPLPEFICGESLKLSNDDSRRICLILSHIDRIQEAISSRDILETGLILRKIASDWDLAARVCAATHNFPVSEFCEQFAGFISESGLIRIWEEKPLLNGAEVAKLLHFSGPSVGKALEMVVRWQILNRTGTREACEEYLLASADSFK